MTTKREQTFIEKYEKENSKRFTTFAEWSEQAEAIETYLWSHGQWERAIFIMNGHKIYIETMMSRNWLKKTMVRIILSEFSHRESNKIIQMAIKMGAFWEEGYYAEEGHGWPIFAGDDGMEKAWNFFQVLDSRETVKTT